MPRCILAPPNPLRRYDCKGDWAGDDEWLFPDILSDPFDPGLLQPGGGPHEDGDTAGPNDDRGVESGAVAARAQGQGRQRIERPESLGDHGGCETLAGQA